MALKLLQPGINPIGQFDGVDSEVLTFKGGEVCALKYVPTPTQPGITSAGFDEAAYDDFDGYMSLSHVQSRPAVTKTFTSTYTGRPLFLADDGIFGYGTLFGAVVGGTVGQQVNGPNSYTGAVLGPSTATGSGKVTCWDKPGLYAVTLDAVDTTAATGLQPTNPSLVGGDAVGFNTSGLLSPTVSGTSLVTNDGTIKTVVGHLVEFTTNGSLVTTPNYLVAALNSPSGNVSSFSGLRQLTQAVIYWAPPST